VEFFLKYAKVRYRRAIWLRQPTLLFKPHPHTEEVERFKQAVSPDQLQAAIEQHQHDPRYTGLGDSDLRAAILNLLVQMNLVKRIRGFDLPLFRGHNLKQWRAYFKFMAETDAETRRSMVYGRLVQGLAPLGEKQAAPDSALSQTSHYGPYDVSRARVALQYWFQYYYDDWANRHEGDWESITLLLELSLDVIAQARELSSDELLGGVTVCDVGYASHHDGYRRLWQDVQTTADGHPIVYVARGSSASYFAWRSDGYPTSARIGQVERLLGGLGSLVRGARFLGRRWDAEFTARFTGRDPKNTDWVAADPQPLDRSSEIMIDAQETAMPPDCTGVRRRSDFGPTAGLDDHTYRLETDDLFWLEMVQEYGVQWGEDYFLPGTKGPSGMDKSRRDTLRQMINHLAQVETYIEDALTQLGNAHIDPLDIIPQLGEVLRPLRPANLKRQDCFPASIRPYVHTAWASILRHHPEAWPGGPGFGLNWVFGRQTEPDPLLERPDPIFHLKSLLAGVRRARYEIQHEGSKWDNPFAWVRYICLADTFYYGIAPKSPTERLEDYRLDCPK
jgi:hypothetical protein